MIRLTIATSNSETCCPLGRHKARHACFPTYAVVTDDGDTLTVDVPDAVFHTYTLPPVGPVQGADLHQLHAYLDTHYNMPGAWRPHIVSRDA